MLMAFGNQLTTKWVDLNMQDVYLDWAESLQSVSIAAIDHGIREAKKEQFPPSQGEFVAHCRTYKPAELLKITSKLSTEQIEINRKRIADIAAMLARSKQA